MVTELERLTGVKTRRTHVDKGNRGQSLREVPDLGHRPVSVVSLPLRREMKLRAAVEPVIGQAKAAHCKLTVDRQYRTQRDCAIASIGRRRSASSGAGWRDF